MTADHLNRCLWNHRFYWLYDAGRLAFPIFAFVLACGMAQNPQAARQVCKRLAVFAVIASIPYLGLADLLDGWWPLNVLFTLLASAAVVAMIQSDWKYRWVTAAAVFVLAGSVVEYWWVGMALFLLFWMYFRKPRIWLLAGMVVAFYALGNINGNQWALASIPVLALAFRVQLNMPRVRHFFYLYYPGHLFVLWGLQRMV